MYQRLMQLIKTTCIMHFNWELIIESSEICQDYGQCNRPNAHTQILG